MPKQTRFIVNGYIERHYRLEIEASSYEEAEEIAEGKLLNSEPSELRWQEQGNHAIICDVECEDSEWDEEDEETQSMEA